jgi:hypothetical protein
LFGNYVVERAAWRQRLHRISSAVVLLGASFLSPGVAQGQASAADSLLTIRVADLSPRFLSFYHQALSTGASSDQRWELWKEHYGFAAVPSTAQGQALARRQLDESWEDYPALLSRIGEGIDGLRPTPEGLLYPVAALLELDRPMVVEIILFVGTRGGSAFSMGLGDHWQMALPIEEDPRDREVTASHEMAHGVHTELAGLKGVWHRSVGQMVLGEGLAMHVAGALYPGRDPWVYTGGGEGWFREAETAQREIIQGVLDSADNATTRAQDRFTMGPGPAGLRREAYYAGWALVGHLLENGWTLPGLARVPRGLMSRVVDRGLRELLEGDE